jgi:hypothetical protein
VQSDGLVNGAEFVVSIGPFAQNFEPQVDFGERAKAKCFWQSIRATGRPDIQPTQSFVEMAPRAKHRAVYGKRILP